MHACVGHLIVQPSVPAAPCQSWLACQCIPGSPPLSLADAGITPVHLPALASGPCTLLQVGFDKKIWSIGPVERTNNTQSVVLMLFSPDGDEVRDLACACPWGLLRHAPIQVALRAGAGGTAMVEGAHQCKIKTND